MPEPKDSGRDDSSSRPPIAAEQSEFEIWYKLAEQFKLVTDYRWEDREYWVYCNGEWETYCELSGIYTVKRLRGFLSQRTSPQPFRSS